MEKKQYSKKELLIYWSVKNMIIKNKNIDNIKVSDIAKEANIGKGTVYEYFKSKDEIIAKSIIYNFKVEINNAINSIKNTSSFKEKCYCLFNYSINSGKFIFPSLRSLYNHVRPGNLNNFILEDCQEILSLENEFYELLDSVIHAGIEENIINNNTDLDYQRYVLISSSLGIIDTIYSKYFENDNIDENEKFNIQKDFAYKMILKSLS